MANPWLKKNPLMSLWMSAANRVAGSVRGHATAQAKRQLTAAVTEATQDNIKLWSAASAPAATRKKATRKR